MCVIMKCPLHLQPTHLLFTHLCVAAAGEAAVCCNAYRAELHGPANRVRYVRVGSIRTLEIWHGGTLNLPRPD
jgi:hypothetical protein